MKHHLAYTLIELLIVISMISIFSLTALISMAAVRGNQALAASSEEFANIVKSAHIYAREGRDNKSWGVRYINDKTYCLISGDKHSFGIERTILLEQPTQFGNGFFEIWFSLGTGETSAGKNIRLKSPQNKTMQVDISKTGLVSVNNI